MIKLMTNVGGLDRTVRIIVGFVLVYLAAIGDIGWWGWIGAIPLVTGIIGSCPAYTLLGIRTCPLAQQEEEKII